jgi:tetratricopeptide (TPR) repeat protein
VADIFVSYTSKDRNWAEWIGQELEKLGHIAHIDAWEIGPGGDIAAWMDERHDKADHILCVVSETYLSKPYSSWERRAAQWAARTDRPNFVLPVRIEDCKLRTLLASVKHCDLFGIEENEAGARLTEFLKPAAKPTGPIPFPGGKKPVSEPKPRVQVAFPVQKNESRPVAISNIPIAVPRYFLGRDDDLAAIERALNSSNGRAAITALHGLRGVGKTTLAAAYADRHRDDYRATWWIRAETESTMRADLVGLGVQLGWVAPDTPEESAVAEILGHLRSDGKGILLIYDSAIDSGELSKFLPRGGEPRIIITSNAPNWGRVASRVDIEVWPREIGADYLIARAGREAEREAALGLAEALDGLPLAHEQAAAYCDRVGVSLAEYAKRFRAAPVAFMDSAQDAACEYHDGLTVAKTFTLAIDEAAKLHRAAEPLIVYASLLAPEPIPLYLFLEARETFAEPFGSLLKDDGLDEAVAALRAFALVDREAIPDERDPSITTDCIRLHRLIRQVAVIRRSADAWSEIQRNWIDAMARVYPRGVHRDPNTWPRARRLDALALALVGTSTPPDGAEKSSSLLLDRLALYRQFVLAAYDQAKPLFERALGIDQQAFGPDHPDTAASLNNLAVLLENVGDLQGSRPLKERALAIYEKALGPDHPHTATTLDNLGSVLESQGDFAGARPYLERALAVREKALGPDHPDTALSLNNLGHLLKMRGDLAEARLHFERALAIREKVLEPDHLDTAVSLNNLGSLLQDQGDLAGARPYLERALAIREKALEPDHPDTAKSLNNLGSLSASQGDLSKARLYYIRALDIVEKKLGLTHPSTRVVAENLVDLFDQLNLPNEAKALRSKFGLPN